MQRDVIYVKQCKCNFCWAFVTTLNAENVVRRKYCGHRKSRKIMRELHGIFFV